KPQILLISKVSIIFNMGLGIPLAKFYGAAGMASATAASFLIKNLIIYVLVRKHVDVQIPWNSVIRSLINSGLTIGLITVALPYIHTHILVDAGLTVILYFTIMKFNPILTEEQKNTFFSLMPKKIAPVAHFIF
ncbi:MAG: polysaccharide biosynthesis C-terminal domain-containing protein, partial [Bacteroidetes bacterium]|nr:polysaccharide biosynthesis C-terminal domain-containing protein [Bacteroidota bacterium]